MTKPLTPRRVWPVAALGWAAALLVVASAPGDRLIGLALGVLFPGGGLAFYGHWPEFALVVSTVVALAARRMVGILALLWAGAALFEITHDPAPDQRWPFASVVIPVLFAATVVALFAARYLRSRRRAVSLSKNDS